MMEPQTLVIYPVFETQSSNAYVFLQKTVKGTILVNVVNIVTVTYFAMVEF